MDNDTSRRRFKAMVPWSGVTMVGSSRGQVGRRRECIYQEEIRDEPRWTTDQTADVVSGIRPR